VNTLSDQSGSVVPVEPTHKMVTEGDRALQLWADESLRDDAMADAAEIARLAFDDPAGAVSMGAGGYSS
jgi:hypothetical protein